MSSKPKTDRLLAFRQAYDKSLIVPAKIETALAALGEDWEPDGAFVKRVGVSNSEFAKYRDQFSDFYIETRPMGKGPVRIWCGTKAFAEACRKTLT
jgi:hypothetical protein